MNEPMNAEHVKIVRQRVAVRQYMRANLDDHLDPLTGEINATTLAEDACDACNGYEDGDIPERFFEWAYEVAEWDRRRRLGIYPSHLGGLVQSRDDCLRG